MQNSELDDLMLRYTAGDGDALAELVERYTPTLTKKAKRCPEVMDNDVEDVVQETWLRIMEIRQEFEPPFEKFAIRAFGTCKARIYHQNMKFSGQDLPPQHELREIGSEIIPPFNRSLKCKSNIRIKPIVASTSEQPSNATKLPSRATTAVQSISRGRRWSNMSAGNTC